jgi:hypothetical protein
VYFLTDTSPLETLRLLKNTAEERRELVSKVEDSFSELDTTMNFKVNSLLKEEFNKVCKKSHTNSSREIKLFMLSVVRKGNF